MTEVVAVVVALALVAFLGAHVALLAHLAARRPRYRALISLAVPPLAPYWAWRAEPRTRVYVWFAAFAVYAVGLVILGR